MTRHFDTGSVRDSLEGKPRVGMIPPAALRLVGHRFGEGAGRYGDFNAHLGQPIMALWDSAFRHWLDFIDGLDDENHLGAALWGGCMMAHVLDGIERGVLPAELDDRPNLADPEWVARIKRQSEAVRASRDDSVAYLAASYAPREQVDAAMRRELDEDPPLPTAAERSHADTVRRYRLALKRVFARGWDREDPRSFARLVEAEVEAIYEDEKAERREECGS